MTKIELCEILRIKMIFYLKKNNVTNIDKRLQIKKKKKKSIERGLPWILYL